MILWWYQYRCNPTALCSVSIWSLFTLAQSFHISFWLGIHLHTQMLLKPQPAALGNLGQLVWDTESGVEQASQASEKGRGLCPPALSAQKMISGWLHLLLGDNQRSSTAAGSGLALSLPSLLLAASQEQEHRSNVNLFFRLLIWRFHSCLLPSFCRSFLSSHDDLWRKKKSVIPKWIIDILSKQSPLLYLFS